MKVLWLTGIPMPDASRLMLKKEYVTGGWLVNLSHLLSSKDETELSIAFPSMEHKNVSEYFDGKIYHYAVPTRNINEIDDSMEEHFIKLIKMKNPDIVHIHGTEYPHTLSMANACNKLNVKFVISIQGLVSTYAKHYMACLPEKIQNAYTFRDFVRQDNIKQQQKKFFKRGQYEIKALKNAKYIIGRTDWDKACTKQINPLIKYFFCNEILRSEFYRHQWQLNQCEMHSIFVSQGYYPIKGLHFMLEAMLILVRDFPNIKLYISGGNIIKNSSLADELKITTYGKYLKTIIKKYNLGQHIVFTGMLNEYEMCKRYCDSHVFVCPSSIENSPNSLGEAMILGLPCVAADVGGISNMLKNREEGFIYQHDAPYMLAYYISEIFSNNELAKEISIKARAHAKVTHNNSINVRNLLGIYEQIINDTDN